MIVAFTGHRPERLPETAGHKMAILMAELKRLHSDLVVISGMAQGWDTLAAKTAIGLDVPFIAAVPWAGHSHNWPEDHRRQYLELLDKAKHVKIVCDTQEFKPWVYTKRDEWMVDNSNILVSAWDGVRKGGTWNTIQYAIRRGRQDQILHVYETP